MADLMTNRDSAERGGDNPPAPAPAAERDKTMTLEKRLEHMEAMLAVLVERQQVREWHTTEQVARIVGKAEYTVREWCRRGRVKAEKRMSGRGAHASWVISHTELLRYQREGLLRVQGAEVQSKAEGTR